MAKAGRTPEEQLLSLIEEGKDLAKLRQKRKRALPFSFGAMKKIRMAPDFLYKTIKARLGKLKTGTGEVSLKPVINILLIIAVSLSAYLIIDFAFGSMDLSHIYERPLLTMQDQPREHESSGQTFLSYLTMVQRRNIFSPVEMQGVQVDDTQAQKQALKQTIIALSAGLRLAGISLGAEPQAMVENKETNETFFLKKGDTVNRLTVQEIFNDRVILSYEGETVELL
jgi:hypothetical protein